MSTNPISLIFGVCEAALTLTIAIGVWKTLVGLQHLKKHGLRLIDITRNITKLINKMVDEGIISEDWGAHDMGTIAKNLGKAVYYDCVKEEPDVVASVDDGFGKFAASIAMKLARDILAERESV